MRPFDSRSSAVSTCATSTVKSGVVALRIEARPLAMWVCPHAMSENGIALFSSPMPKKASQVLASHGIGERVARSTRCRAAAAIATRSSTMVKGGTVLTTTPTKKNDPPHRIERASSRDQSRRLMRAEVGICDVDTLARGHASRILLKKLLPQNGGGQGGGSERRLVPIVLRLPPPQPSPGSGEGVISRGSRVLSHTHGQLELPPP